MDIFALPIMPTSDPGRAPDGAGVSGGGYRREAGMGNSCSRKGRKGEGGFAQSQATASLRGNPQTSVQRARAGGLAGGQGLPDTAGVREEGERCWAGFDPIRKICTTLGHSTDSYEADMKLPSPDVVTLGKDSRIGCDST